NRGAERIMSQRIRTAWLRTALIGCVAVALVARAERPKGPGADPLPPPAEASHAPRKGKPPTIVITPQIVRELHYLTPRVPLHDYTVQKGDTLWSIAKKLYAKGLSWLWLRK